MYLQLEQITLVIGRNTLVALTTGDKIALLVLGSEHILQQLVITQHLVRMLGFWCGGQECVAIGFEALKAYNWK